MSKEGINRKRSITDVLVDDDIRPLKKCKVEGEGPTTKILSHPKDKRQFIEIYTALRLMKLPVEQSESVPNCIIAEIAEYATGELEECDNPTCDEKVVVLGIDNSKEEGAESYNPEHALYLYDSEKNVFYCKSCKDELYWCEDCKRWVPYWNCGECEQCGTAILNCRSRSVEVRLERYRYCCYSLEYVCGICSAKACSNCDVDGCFGRNFCNECNVYHCKKCLAKCVNKGRVDELFSAFVLRWSYGS